MLNLGKTSAEFGENYGKVVEDCSKAMQLSPSHIKAYFRCAKAQAALHKWQVRGIVKLGFEKRGDESATIFHSTALAARC